MPEKNEQAKVFGSQLDAQLMAAPSRNAGSEEKAGDLRAAKRQDVQESGNFSQSAPSEQPTSLREAVLQEKKQKAAKEKEEGGGLASKAMSPARKGTSALLREAWIYLIPSYGLTLIWINIHVFLGMILGNNLFCKLGVEWSDKVSGATAKGGAMQKKIEEKAGSSIGLVEKIGVGCADIGCLLILIFVIAIIALIIKVVSNPIGFYAEAVGWAWDAARNAIGKIVSGE